MFWPFLGVVFLSAMVFQLGALSAWLLMAKVGFMVAGIALVLVTAVFLRRRLRRSRRQRLIEHKS